VEEIERGQFRMAKWFRELSVGIQLAFAV